MTNSPKTLNYSNFGFFKRIAANTERQPKAGAAYVVGKGGFRVKVRTTEELRSAKKAVSWLNKRLDKLPGVITTQITYRVRLVKANIKLNTGKTLKRVCKVSGSDGTKKIFATKKAALAWIKSVA